MCVLSFEAFESVCAPRFDPTSAGLIGNSLTSFSRIFGSQSRVRIGQRPVQSVGQPKGFPKRPYSLMIMRGKLTTCGFAASGKIAGCA